MSEIFKPNSLGECDRADRIAEDLYNWATWIKIIGITAAVIVAISGMISASNASGLLRDLSSSMLISSLILAALIFGGSMGEALILEALASIVKSNSIQARAAMAMVSSGAEKKPEIPDELKF